MGSQPRQHSPPQNQPSQAPHVVQTGPTPPCQAACSRPPSSRLMRVSIARPQNRFAIAFILQKASACWSEPRHVCDATYRLAQQLTAGSSRYTRSGLVLSMLTAGSHASWMVQRKPCISTPLIRTIDAHRDNNPLRRHAFHAAPTRDGAAEQGTVAVSAGLCCCH